MAARSHTFGAGCSAPMQSLGRAHGSFLSHVVTLAGGTGVSQGISVLGTLVLARLIAPRDFGLFALFVTVVTFVSVIGGARYELAIMLPERDSEAANVAVMAAGVAALIAAASVPLIAAFGIPLARLLGDYRAEQWLWFIPPVLLLNGFGEVGRNWFGRKKDFRLVAAARISQSIGLIGGQFTLWAAGFGGGIALIGGWLIGQLMWTGMLVGCLVATDGRFIRSEFRLSFIPKLAAKYKAFPMYRTPYSFLANGTSQLVFVIFRVFCGLNIVGIYLMANRAVYFPVSLFGSSMGQVFYQKAASEIKSKNFESFVNRLIRSQIALAAPLLIFFAFEAPLIFDTILGPRWQTAGTFAAWLAFAGFLYLFNNWLARLYDVCGHQRLALLLQLGAGATSLGALTVALYFGHQPIWGIAAFTISEVICSTIWVICAFVIADFHVRNLLRFGKDFAYAALPISGVGFLVHHFLHPWPACILLAVATACATWVLWQEYGTKRSNAAWTPAKFLRNWPNKRAQLRRTEPPDFHRGYLDEIKELFPSNDLKHVLEIGCGDGSAFPHLNLPIESYSGIDISSRFLNKFRSQYPRINLKLAEASSFVEPESRYDVIFSDGVIQHFDPEMLDRHLGNARLMMHAGSVLIFGSVPDRAYIRKVDSGAYAATLESRARGYAQFAKGAICRALRVNRDCGFWYAPSDIVAMAQRHGFRARVVPSKLQPYRFHAVMSPDRPLSNSVAAQGLPRAHSAS